MFYYYYCTISAVEREKNKFPIENVGRGTWYLIYIPGAARCTEKLSQNSSQTHNISHHADVPVILCSSLLICLCPVFHHILFLYYMLTPVINVWYSVWLMSLRSLLSARPNQSALYYRRRRCFLITFISLSLLNNFYFFSSNRRRRRIRYMPTITSLVCLISFFFDSQ